MKKFVLAFTVLAAFSATPTMAGSYTHISTGFYTPQPTYYASPVAYHPVAYSGYYAPRRTYCPPRYGYGAGLRYHYRAHANQHAIAGYNHRYVGKGNYVNPRSGIADSPYK